MSPTGSTVVVSFSTDEISKHLAAGFFKTLAAATDVKLFKPGHINSYDAPLLSFADTVFANVSTDVQILQALTILEAPRLVMTYPAVANLPDAKVVNPAWVKDILLNHVSVDTVTKLCVSKALTIDLIIALLEYLKDESPLVGLPLLLSSDVPIAVPGPADERIYLWSGDEHAQLFASRRFLRPEYSKESLASIWSTVDINVGKLTSQEVFQLTGKELALQTSHTMTEKWLTQFWRVYPSLPGPPEISSFKRANLAIVRGTTRHLTLEECVPGRVVYLANSSKRVELRAILQGLRIEVLRLTGNAPLASYFDAKFPSSILNVLACLHKANITRLPVVDCGELIEWIKDEIRNNTPIWRSTHIGVPRSFLSRLAIWAARTSEGDAYCSADELKVLPFTFPVDGLPLVLGVQVASYDTRLVDLLRFCRNVNALANVCISVEEVLNAVNFPSSIGPTMDDVQIFKTFLRNILSTYSSVPPRLVIYDGDGNARSPADLYDHTVELFSVTLAHTAHSSFVHPHLRDIEMCTLHSLGLNHKVSLETFRFCALAVQSAVTEAQTSGSPIRSEKLHSLYEMSRVAFQHYSSTLPALIMTDRPSWASLDNIAFVRPKDARRQGASYPAEGFCATQLAPLLPLSGFILPAYEPIAWTQYGLFFDEPAENLTSLNKNLGTPNVQSVVSASISNLDI